MILEASVWFWILVGMQVFYCGFMLGRIVEGGNKRAFLRALWREFWK